MFIKILLPSLSCWRVINACVFYSDKVDAISNKELFNNLAWNKSNNILQEIIRKYPNDIDVYGKICRNRKNIKPYKTILPHRKKEKGLLEYRYNLAIENGSTDYYFSEKIVDPLLCWSIPIYWGCKKIDKFLPKESYILLDMNKKGVAEEIIKISKSVTLLANGE